MVFEIDEMFGDVGAVVFFRLAHNPQAQRQRMVVLHRQLGERRMAFERFHDVVFLVICYLSV
jgi:hypothetical protein